jgi:hypothetical protein
MTTDTNESGWEAPRRCSATRFKDGAPCRSFATDTGKCARHSMSPEQRSQAARAGAAVTNEVVLRRKAQEAAQKVTEAISILPAGLPVGPVKIGSPREFEETLVQAITATMDGSLPPSRAKAVASLLKLKIDAASLAISEKLVELDRRMNEQKKGRA